MVLEGAGLCILVWLKGQDTLRATASQAWGGAGGAEAATLPYVVSHETHSTWGQASWGMCTVSHTDIRLGLVHRLKLL